MMGINQAEPKDISGQGPGQGHDETSIFKWKERHVRSTEDKREVLKGEIKGGSGPGEVGSPIFSCSPHVQVQPPHA